MMGFKSLKVLYSPLISLILQSISNLKNFGMKKTEQGVEATNDGVCLRILKAQHGDAFILEVKRWDERFVMVIDGGPKSVYQELEKHLKELEIDLMVLTHFDEDHILGMLWFLKNNRDKAESVKKYWLNMPHLVEMPTDVRNTSYGQALKLSNFMEELEKTNPELDWREEVIDGIQYDVKNMLVNIEVLTPSSEAKKANEIAFAEKLDKKLKAQGKMLPLGASSKEVAELDNRKENQKKPLEDLVEKEYSSEQTCNAASISMLITTFDGTKLLMAGDITPDELAKALIGRGYSKENPLEVDLFKMPHHGSKFNVTCELMSLVRTTRYLISTNGGHKTSFHPDRETIAKILLNPGREKDKKILLFLNYPLAKIRLRVGNFITDEEIRDEDKKYNFELIDNCESINLNREAGL